MNLGTPGQLHTVPLGEQTGDAVNKFARCEWEMAPDNLPVLVGAQYWFAGPIVNVVVFGDHTGFVIEPDRGAATEQATELLSSLADQGFEPGHGA